MELSNEGIRKLKEVYVGCDSMWRLLLNTKQMGYNTFSGNYEKCIFDLLDAYSFRILNTDGEPLFYGLCSEKNEMPLFALKDMYSDAMYIEYGVKGGGWLRIPSSIQKERPIKQYFAYNKKVFSEVIILAESYEQAEKVAKKDGLQIMGKVSKES